MREQHLAAVGRERAGIGDAGVGGGRIDRQGQQAVAGEVERHAVARTERDRAQPGRDQAFIAHLRAHQRGKAAGVDGAQVGHRPRAAVVLEDIPTVQKIGVREVQARADKPGGINARAV